MENKYCVYLHRRKSDNVPFYIGSGVQGKREYHFTARSKAWHSFVDNDSVAVEILASNLSEKQARIAETEFITNFDKPLVNSRKPIVNNDLDIELLKQYLKYDETSPTYLRWIKSSGPRAKVGAPAGNLYFSEKRNKYVSSLKIDGINTRLHRVVWALHNGGLTGSDVIDHIDGNSVNNSIGNLRKVTQAVNSRNRLRNSNTYSKFHVGIYNESNSFKASVTFGLTHKNASFSINKYGYDVALKKAIAWRSANIQHLNTEHVAGYTDKHFEYSDYDYSHESGYYYKTDYVYPKRTDGLITSVCVDVLFNGKKRVKSFSVSLYTEDVALQMAVDFKNKQNYTESDFATVLPVDMYIEGLLVKTFDSLTSASIETNVDMSSISRCCKGKQRTTGGRKGNPIRTWKYHKN